MLTLSFSNQQFIAIGYNGKPVVNVMKCIIALWVVCMVTLMRGSHGF